MPENFIELPDGKKLVVFETSRHPDFQGTVINIQETLKADIPTYQITANNVAVANNTNILSVFNNLFSKRIRIQHIYCYPYSSAANDIVLQLGSIDTSPAGGTDATFDRFAADFDDNPQTNNIISKIGSSTNPTEGIVLGGNAISLNNFRDYDLFVPKGNASAIQLRPRPNAEGIVIRQVSGGNTGTITVHVIFTLD